MLPKDNKNYAYIRYLSNEKLGESKSSQLMINRVHERAIIRNDDESRPTDILK